MSHDVLVTGGTGYIGQRLIVALSSRGHRVRALAREASVSRVPRQAVTLVGDALDAGSVAAALRAGDTLVHLVGTPHPGPGKALEFQRVDLASIRASVAAARQASIAHVVYLSVAQPAPVMRDYIAVRAEGERLIAEAGLTATFVRPWYVLGPGHRWPVLLAPLYWSAELIPSWRDGARRMGLVTMEQMVNTLAHVVEHPPSRGMQRVVDVEEIRAVQAAHAS